MTVPTTTQRITEADLIAMGSDARVEVIEGELVQMTPVGILHHIIAGNIYRILDSYVQKHKNGLVFMDGLLYLMAREGKGIKGALVPDVSLIRSGQIPDDWDLERPFPGAPALAVEVMSPDDAVEDVLNKVRQYLATGTEQVWVVFPRQKELHQYQRGTPQVQTITATETFDVSVFLPGLMLSMPDVFDVPDLGKSEQ